MNTIIKAIVIVLGGALTLTLAVIAFRAASLTYAAQAAAAFAVSLTLVQSVSTKEELPQRQITRNQRMIAIGLVIGLLGPALALWLIVYNAHHQ